MEFSSFIIKSEVMIVRTADMANTVLYPNISARMAPRADPQFIPAYIPAFRSANPRSFSFSFLPKSDRFLRVIQQRP